MLKNFEKKKELALILISIIHQSIPWINGLLAKIESGDSFRDFVAHKGATMEKMSNCFGITFVDNQRALLLDCELDRFPLFRTSIGAVQHISFTVLNLLSACTGQSVLPIEEYKSQWVPKTIVFSEFLIDEPANSTLSGTQLTVVQNMHPDGFVVSTRNVNPEIFNHVIDLRMGDRV